MSKSTDEITISSNDIISPNNSQLTEKEATVKQAPATVEEATATVEQAPDAVEQVLASANSEVDPNENLLSELEDTLRKQESLEAILDKLETAVGRGVAENVPSSDKGNSAKGNSAQRTQAQGDQAQGDQEDLYEGNNSTEKPKDKFSEGQKKNPLGDMLVAVFEAVFGLIERLSKGFKEFAESFRSSTKEDNQAKNGSDVGSGHLQESKSQGRGASSPQMASEQVAKSAIPNNPGSTSSLSDSKTSEEAPESDKSKGSLQERITSLINSCKDDPNKMKTVEDFLEKGKKNLNGEELENFNEFEKMVDEEFKRQKIERTAPQNQAKEQPATPSFDEGVEGSAKEGVTKEEVQKEEVDLSSNGVVPGPEEGEKKAPGKIELRELPGIEEVTKDLAAVGVTSSDLGNSSSAPAPAAISAPAAREVGGRG